MSRRLVLSTALAAICVAGACAGAGSGAIAAAGVPAAGVVEKAPAAMAAGAQSVAARLQVTLGQGYERRDAATVLGFYAPDATVRTRLYGEISLGLFKKVLESDFASLQDGVKAVVSLNGFTVADGVGTATVGFVVTGTLENGKPVKRNEIWYFRMREEHAGWRAFKQSYLADFSLPPGGDPAVQTETLKTVPFHGKSH